MSQQLGDLAHEARREGRPIPERETQVAEPPWELTRPINEPLWLPAVRTRKGDGIVPLVPGLHRFTPPVSGREPVPTGTARQVFEGSPKDGAPHLELNAVRSQFQHVRGRTFRNTGIRGPWLVAWVTQGTIGVTVHGLGSVEEGPRET